MDTHRPISLGHEGFFAGLWVFVGPVEGCSELLRVDHGFSDCSEEVW